MSSKRNARGTAIAAFLIASTAYAITQLEFSSPVELSDQAPDIGLAFKPKLVLLANGQLVSVYGDAIENDPTRYVYDPKSDLLHPARDVFARRCDSVNTDCADPANWSPPVNIANTAASSSIDSDWDGGLDGSNVRKPYYGDSDKPNVYRAGNRVVVTWVDKYCPDGDVATPAIEPTAQRTVTYEDRDSIEVPFGCLYVVSSANGGASWTPPVQLSSGLRDAKQDVSRGLGSGHWAVIWQEDPSGLKLGEAEGPGDGAAGARVAKGTDIWYTFADPAWSDPDDSDALGFWHPPARLTDNYAGQASGGDMDVVSAADGTIVDMGEIEGGTAGASRPNLALVDDTARSGKYIAVVAYEETKGSQGLDEGKFIRYHSFVWNQVGSDDPSGCVISAPDENSRRVRIVAQKGVGRLSGLRVAVFWRQGTYNQGGPSDIMLRLGYADHAEKTVTGLEPAQMMPPVDPACVTSDYDMALTLDNQPGFNVSSQTPNAISANLADTTGANSYEDARAHRGVLRGDDFYIGWTYTADWAVARYTDMENYNFWLRHFDGALDSWGVPLNVSRIEDTTISVREPRLMGMPGNGPNCADPANPVDPEECQNASTLIAAWGTETNVYEHVGGAVDLEIYYTRTTDKAASFEPAVVVPGRGDNARSESQLRVRPAGNVVYAVWSERDASTQAENAMFATAIATTDEPPVALVSAAPSVGVGEVVTLDGSNSSDPEDRALSYFWTLRAPAGSTAVLSDAFGMSPEFIVDIEGPYVATLIVNDGAQDSAPTTVIPIALTDQAPVAEAGANRTVNVGTRVTLDGSRSSDREDSVLAWTWTLSGPDGSRAVLSDPTSAKPDFIADVAGTYAMTLVVNDGTQDSVPDEVVITAVPLDADLGISLGIPATRIAASRAFNVELTVTDVGPGEAHDVLVQIDLPAGVELRRSADCQPSASGISCRVERMGAGSSGTLSATLYATGKGLATISASVSSEMTDPNAADNATSASFEIVSDDSGGGAAGLLELMVLGAIGLIVSGRRPDRL